MKSMTLMKVNTTSMNLAYYSVPSAVRNTRFQVISSSR